MKFLIENSYQMGNFRDNDDSLRRLKRQADIVVELELNQLKKAGLSTGQRVLDLGCGPGIISSHIAERIAPSELLAVDCNDISLNETKKLFERKGHLNVRVANYNVYDPALRKEGYFDFVYSRLVFQHLSEPLKALENVSDCLKPGAKICICDVDDQWLSVSPKTEKLDSFIGRVRLSQERRGGDRNVGTKLPSYLMQSGFVDVRSDAILISADSIGKDTFFDLVFGYKREVVPNDELVLAEEELKDIRENIYSEYGWAGISVFFVSGTKV